MSRFWRHRTLCDVLEEMRKCNETRNYAPIAGLIEEAQSMGNRMESGLAEVKDLQKMSEAWATARKELKKTEETLKKLNNQVKQLSQQKKELRDETAKEKGKLKKYQQGQGQSAKGPAFPCGGPCSRGSNEEDKIQREGES